jgi:hypothetical protein
MMHEKLYPLNVLVKLETVSRLKREAKVAAPRPLRPPRSPAATPAGASNE